MDLPFSRPCRACMCNVERNEVNSNHIEMFAFCTSIKVMILKEDILSVCFCDKCAVELVQCFNFINKCLKTDNELQMLYYGNILNTNAENINEVKVENENSSDEGELNHFGEAVDFEEDKSVKFESEVLQIKKEISHNGIVESKCKKKHVGLKKIAKHTNKNGRTKPVKKKKARKKHIEPYEDNIFPIDNKYKRKNKLCPVCEIPFPKIKLLDYHLKNDHPNYTKFKCHICNKGFRYPAAMQLHFNKHSKLKKYECDVCHKFYKFKGALKTHIQSHIFGKHECSKCQKSFESLHALKTHTILHKGHKPHLCDTCGQGFALVTNLKVHMRIHSGERPYSCHVCPYTASFYAAFRRHKLSHTRSGRKPCTTCGKDFADLGSLKRHMRLHTGDLPYKCDYCQMGFIDGWKRRVHIAKRHNIALADIPHLAQRRNATQILPDSDEDIK